MNKRLPGIGKRLLLVVSMFGVAAANAAPTVDLTGKGFVTYGDAQSYSLPLSGLEVMAGPGQIDVFTKLGLGANGQLDNPQAGMDNAFDTPQANPIEGFRTGTDPEPGGNAVEGGWDRLGWWDSSLQALNDALDLVKNSIVFFFANNEIGDKVKPDDPDVLVEGDRASLAAWMRVEVTQISSGDVLGVYDLTNDPDGDGVAGYGPPPLGGGVPLGDVASYTSDGSEPVLADFAMSGGAVCVKAGVLAPCDGTEDLEVQHNLGGDRAAYAVVLPELDALIASLLAGDPGDYAIHVDYRLGCGSEAGFDTVRDVDGDCFDKYALNGGDEKLFIGTQALEEQQIPEPSSILLTALGLAAVAGVRASFERGRRSA